MLALYMTKKMKLNFSALAVGHKSRKFAGKTEFTSFPFSAISTLIYIA
jgi:hypothetical protein